MQKLKSVFDGFPCVLSIHLKRATVFLHENEHLVVIAPRPEKVHFILEDQQTKGQTTYMKTDTVVTSVLIALVVSIAQAAPDSPVLEHTLTVTPEIKRAFHSGDAIEIREIRRTK